MDRITGKDAKLMMEALASVYIKEEVEQEVISEEVAETELVLENEEQKNLMKIFFNSLLETELFTEEIQRLERKSR